MSTVIKEVKKNWLVLLFVIIQAIFVVGVKSAQIDAGKQQLEDLERRVTQSEIREQTNREILIEVRTDVKWMKTRME